jgi:hypothetical protein
LIWTVDKELDYSYFKEVTAMSDELIHYISRVALPAFAFIVFLFSVPKKAKPLRIFSVILLFILLRDAMTPTGLWKITSTLELRFVDQPLTLWLLAISSVGLIFLSRFAIGHLGPWNKRPIFESIIIGLSAGILVAVLPYSFGQWTTRAPSVKAEGVSLLLAIAALAFLGNLLEEAIFRGHFQNYLYELNLSDSRVILLSGSTFSLCHSFLAFTVTHAGWPILAFTFYEGIICAYLRHRNGLLSAALAHGAGLFLILSGWLG